MKKFSLVILLLLSLVFTLSACGKNEFEIVVGATKSPHSEILNCEAVKNYVESKGYTLKVKIYHDYVTPNKALQDEALDANYFQHIPYLTEEIETKGYDLKAACQVHNEPLNLYGIVKTDNFENETIYIINDASNVERAYKLLQANGLIDTYSVENFNANNPVYTTSVAGLKIECIDSGLLRYKVEEDAYAVIPGNFALTAWGAQRAAEYKVFGESVDVAYPNIIACRSEDLNSDKIKILVEALAQEEVREFIESTYGPTVNYVFESFIK